MDKSRSGRCRAHNHTNTEMNESKSGRQILADKQIQAGNREIRTEVDEEQIQADNRQTSDQT
ncbi:hypothetical protein Tco_0996048, partial [Tanacetum coccineum]